MEFVVSGSRGIVDSTRPHHIVRLDTIMPEGMDIAAFRLSHVPDGLEAVLFNIGYTARVRFERADLVGRVPVDVRLSKCTYNVSFFEFVYSDVESRQEAELVDETETVPVLGDTVTVWDGYNELELPTILGYEEMKTGRQVLRVTKGMDVDVPEVTFVLCPGRDDSGYSEVPVSERFVFYPSEWTAEKTKAWHGLVETEDGTSFEDAVARGVPFNARMRNVVRYTSNMAGMKYALN